MTEACFKLKNLTVLGYRKVQRFFKVSAWKSVIRNPASIIGVKDQRPVERTLWLIMRVAAIFLMIYFMWDITMEYKMNLTITNPETRPYSIQKINYPAIAICSINRISKKAKAELAAELMEFENTLTNANLTLPELTNMLQLLDQLYRHQVNEEDKEMTEFLHRILEQGYKGYNVNRIMMRLTPKCRSILLKCSWNGKDQVCDDIFLMRRTQDGYCCTFNYVRRYNDFGSTQNILIHQNLEHSIHIGSEHGLSVLLNPQLDDYTYRTNLIKGFKVFVYNTLDYPDMESGGLREITISPKTEMYVNINALPFYTTKDVQKYDILERDCLFQTEQPKTFHGYYSFSECILHCRLHDIIHLCNCLPFFYPTNDEIATARVCNLKDIYCLNKYQDRWRYVKPRFEQYMIPFDEDAFNGTSGYLNCNCFPSCEDVTYSVKLNSIPLSLSELWWGRNNYQVDNHSVVHIYFGKKQVIRLRQDVLFYWYELMSNYGSICCLFLGISIISVIEILYGLIIRISDYIVSLMNRSIQWINKDRMKDSRKDAKASTIAVPRAATILEAVPPLHWQEIARVLPKKPNLSNLMLNQLLK